MTNLKSPSGEITRGFAAHRTRWAAVKGCGLVDLHAAAGLVRAEVTLPDRVFHAYRSLVAGVTPQQHATRHRIRCKLAWDYFSCAAPHVSNARALGQPMVDADLWDALEAMGDDPLLGGPLKRLRTEVSKRLGRAVPWEQLRFARTCLV